MLPEQQTVGHFINIEKEEETRNGLTESRLLLSQ